MKAFTIILFLLYSCLAMSWDGYNYDTNSYIDIESYDHQGYGKGEVEYYDYEDGEYKQGYLDMHSGGEGTLTDYDSGDS